MDEKEKSQILGLAFDILEDNAGNNNAYWNYYRSMYVKASYGKISLSIDADANLEILKLLTIQIIIKTIGESSFKVEIV